MGLFEKQSKRAKVMNVINKEYGCITNFLKDIKFQAFRKGKLVYDATKE